MTIPSDVLDDICCRFLVNLPDSERNDPIRLCFQAELAHWFYIDFYCKNKEKPSNCVEVGLREFIRIMFNYCHFLKHLSKNVDKIVDEWRAYKALVPAYGAILLDTSLNHVLLVQGYYAKHSWGFPKGKINEDEDPWKCAIREVLEETDYDISLQLKRHRCIQRKVGENPVQLYIIPDVSMHYPFKPRTRCEIRKIQWFPISDLTANRKKTSNEEEKSIGNANSFYTVIPFVEDLRNWTDMRKQKREKIDHKETASASAFRRATQKSPFQSCQSTSGCNHSGAVFSRLLDKDSVHSGWKSIDITLLGRPVYSSLESTQETKHDYYGNGPKACPHLDALPNMADRIVPAKEWADVRLNLL